MYKASMSKVNMSTLMGNELQAFHKQYQNAMQFLNNKKGNFRIIM